MEELTSRARRDADYKRKKAMGWKNINGVKTYTTYRNGQLVTGEGAEAFKLAMGDNPKSSKGKPGDQKRKKGGAGGGDGDGGDGGEEGAGADAGGGAGGAGPKKNPRRGKENAQAANHFAPVAVPAPAPVAVQLPLLPPPPRSAEEALWGF